MWLTTSVIYGVMKIRGYFLTILSAVIFGFTPIIAKMTYSMGSNGITMAFYRHLMVIPFLMAIIKIQKLDYKITRNQLKKICQVGIIGTALTLTMLYSSYSYIQVGSATVLHFMYPLFVSLISVFYYHEVLTKNIVICLIVASIGIIFFIELGSGSLLGIIMALFSGVTFAYYMVGLEKTGLQNLNPYVLNLYFAIVISIALMILGLVSNQIVFVLPLKAYGYSLIVAILTSIVGIICLQMGIKYLGAPLAAILSMFEPVTSVIVGIIVLNEQLSLFKVIGCCLILGAITYLIITNSKRETI